ncbi:MAG: hypothetical protein R3F49_13975 [Planctomycetota bacterium]
MRPTRDQHDATTAGTLERAPGAAHRPARLHALQGRGAATSGAPSRRVTWARGVWAAMLVLHLWPLAKVGAGIFAGEGGLPGFLALLAAQALFAAKLADVRWLRLPSRRGAVVAFLIATCLAHPEVAFEQLGLASKTAAVVTLAVAPAAARAEPKRWLARFLRDAARAGALWRDQAGLLVRRRRALAPVPVPVQGARFGRAPPRSIRH